MTARLRPVAGYVVLVAVLSTVPAVFTRVPFYTLATAVLMVLLAIGALGLVPLTGLARQVSIGQAAFYGIGGYTSAILSTRYQVDPWWGLLAGSVLAAAVAWSLGTVIFRAQGHYLSLATLAFGLALAALVNELPATGRNAGLSGVPPFHIFGVSLTTDLSIYWLYAALLLIATVTVHLLLRSHVGSALTAAGDSPIAAAAAGIDISALRRTAFVVSAVLASVAGSGYAHWFRYVDPSMLGLLNSVQLLIIVTVGGRESVWGAPLGAFTVVTLAEVVRGRLPGSEAGAELTAYGVVLALSLLLLPRGLAGLPAALRRRAGGAR
ncbi:branched-chain amino acid ABC transporter permease [Paractinoplanes brasiliensis]|uniref:Amino acid/amide ABC transporter membrane protein 2 (HAAT family) n=1 Tax=Paractinoplanes brasiliensis TaxID=52695 RepID=A0A4R6JP04_9ACTN|nr:branched-chain amino acid ABC transporter permease [Actinoplanes brasiliensis]TDO37111.1 amino acid/amide ABC transporter membrane protein 2 (HAAT family) [Actinoplanes brasiliensis]GID32195.1 branched-chain amino acid ABC transporter permease [Actinoplanes brasiliensis]